ncbi:SUKH-4 family immunity protein [Kitasatospora sp. NPDC001175]|uniref:SUKH-4 family immunity protein n=1 Tax=Kitasatospora sp. NPDC001175 TaxID=3157103 RepID=UPI003D0716AE
MTDGGALDGWVSIDCTGLSLEQVSGAVAEVAPSCSGLVLEHVELAGPLISSTEWQRIGRWVQTVACTRAAARKPVVIKKGAAQPIGVPESVHYELPGTSGQRMELLLAAAAALELPRSPFEVWQAVVEALVGSPLPGESLRQLAAGHPDLAVDDEAGLLGFRDAMVHREVRRRFPLTEVQQSRVFGALVDLYRGGIEPEGAVAEYLSAALPVHAALAGELARWLEDPDFLVTVGWYGLGLGLLLAYPDGVPLGGVAGVVHYLLGQHLDPASQAEWLSWLHHGLMSRRMTELAGGVTARTTLPWRTVWSHWHWPGVVSPSAEVWPGGRLGIVEWGEGAAVASWAEPSDRPDWEGFGEEDVVAVWDFQTGQPLQGPVSQGQSQAGARLGPEHGVVKAHVRRGRWFNTVEQAPLAGLPGPISLLSEAIRCPDPDDDRALWVFVGRVGIFAALVDEAAVAALPSARRGKEIEPLTGRGRWAPPERIPPGATVTRELLEEDWAFGPGACRTIPPERLPEDVVHAPTVRFLTDVGWPATELASLRPADLALGSLQRWEHRPGFVAGLGTLRGRVLLLDGNVGQVFLGGDGGAFDGPPTPVAGSLAALLHILLLWDAVSATPVLEGEDDAQDLQDSIEGWLREIDPAPVDRGFWELEFAEIFGSDYE